MVPRSLVALAVAAVVACGGGLAPGELSPGHWTNFDGSQQEHTVAYTTQVTSMGEWVNTPWSRADDDPTIVPAMLAVSEDNFACVIDGTRWAMLKRGDRLACKWRFPRVRP